MFKYAYKINLYSKYLYTFTLDCIVLLVRFTEQLASILIRIVPIIQTFTTLTS